MAATVGLWGFIFVSFLAASSVGSGGRLQTWSWAWLSVISLSGLALCLALAALHGLTRPLGRRTRWTLLVVAGGLGAVVQAALDQALMPVFSGSLGDQAIAFDPTSRVINLLLYLWIFFFYLAGVALAESALAAQRFARDALEARQVARDVELQLLKSQLSPHLIFNVLNGLSSLVITGRNVEAEDMIGRLARFLRMRLSPDVGSMTTLEDEFDAVDAYLDIEKPRLSVMPSIELDLPPVLRRMPVPALILQPLVENAMRHAIGPRNGRGHVSVVARMSDDTVILSVTDDGSGEPLTANAGTGTGLSNIRRRLALHYGSRARLETSTRADGGFHAAIVLPGGAMR